MAGIQQESMATTQQYLQYMRNNPPPPIQHHNLSSPSQPPPPCGPPPPLPPPPPEDGGENQAKLVPKLETGFHAQNGAPTGPQWMPEYRNAWPRPGTQPGTGGLFPPSYPPHAQQPPPNQGLPMQVQQQPGQPRPQQQMRPMRPRQPMVPMQPGLPMRPAQPGQPMRPMQAGQPMVPHQLGPHHLGQPMTTTQSGPGLMPMNGGQPMFAPPYRLPPGDPQLEHIPLEHWPPMEHMQQMQMIHTVPTIVPHPVDPQLFTIRRNPVYPSFVLPERKMPFPHFVKPKKNTQLNNSETSSTGDGADVSVIADKKRKSMSKFYPTKPWNKEDAEKALKVELDAYKNQAKTLLVRFPDPMLSRDIVKEYHTDIDKVHFQVPSGPRYCFIQLSDTADMDKVIKEMNEQDFHNLGKLKVEHKDDKPEEDVTADKIDPYTLYVGNLPLNISANVVKEKFPTSLRIDVGYAQRMKYTRYAFIRYQTVEDAIDGFLQSQNLVFDSRNLVVRFRRQVPNQALPESKKQRKEQLKQKKQIATGVLTPMASEILNDVITAAPVDAQPQQPPARLNPQFTDLITQDSESSEDEREVDDHEVEDDDELLHDSADEICEEPSSRSGTLVRVKQEINDDDDDEEEDDESFEKMIARKKIKIKQELKVEPNDEYVEKDDFNEDDTSL